MSVRERSVIFTGPMVNAILAGVKSQTRRVVKEQPSPEWIGKFVHLGGGVWGWHDGDLSGEWRCPYGAAGDRLYVKEGLLRGPEITGIGQHGITHASTLTPVVGASPAGGWCDRALWPWKGKSLSARFCPRWASRLLLEVVEVRVQRVQEISEADAVAEGMVQQPNRTFDGGGSAMGPTARHAFMRLWNTINGRRPGCRWADDPWCWCVTFRRVEAAT